MRYIFYCDSLQGNEHKLDTGTNNIATLQALDQRMQLSHPKKGQVRAQLKKELAGVKGDTSLAYSLNFLTEKDYTILHDPPEVTRSKSLLFHIQQLHCKYTKPVVSQGKLEEVSDYIAAEHTAPETNVLDKFHIHKGELIKGILCPVCASRPLAKRDKKWFCPRCNNTSIDAHLLAFYNHKMLLRDHFTNRGTRDLLQINPPSATKRLLQRERFPAIGKNKMRKYILDFGKRS